MTRGSGPVGSPKPSGPRIRITDVQIFRSGTKIGSLTIIFEDCGLAIYGCLIHQTGNSRWVQFLSRAFLKPDGTRGFETTHAFASSHAKVRFTSVVLQQFDAYAASHPVQGEPLADLDFFRGKPQPERRSR
jgi:hypothetical protein